MIFPVLLLGFVLRLVHLNQSLWLDEATTVIASSKSLESILFHLKLDFHPPLYYFFLHFWMAIFGQSEWVVRMPSVVFGLGTIYFLYKIGKTIYSNGVALTAALILTLSQFHIYYSQEARMYSLAAFVSTLSVFFFLKLVKKPSKTGAVLYGLATALAIYSDYFSFFVVFAQVIWFVYERRGKLQKWSGYFLSGLVMAFLLYIPWIPRFFEQTSAGSDAVTSAPEWTQAIGGVSARSIPLTLSKFTTGNLAFTNKNLYLIYIFIPTLVGMWLVANYFYKKKIDLIGLWLGTPILASFILSFKIPIYAPFRLLPVLPAYLLVISWSLARLRFTSRLLLAGILAFWAFSSLGLYIFNPTFQREDWRGTVKYIEDNSKGHRAITIFVNKAQYSPYRYYAGQVEAGGPESWRTVSYDRIWLMRYLQPLFDPQDRIRVAIESSGYHKFDQKTFRGVEFWGYQK